MGVSSFMLSVITLFITFKALVKGPEIIQTSRKTKSKCESLQLAKKTY
jgi:hypothetical protein